MPSMFVMLNFVLLFYRVSNDVRKRPGSAGSRPGSAAGSRPGSAGGARPPSSQVGHIL